MTVVGISLLGAAVGAALVLMLQGGGVRTASASAAPCAPAASTAVAQAPPLAPQAVAVHPAPAAAPRPQPHATLYASGQHLRYSWRTSMVRWLGGTPGSTPADREAALREGWWGEVVPPGAVQVASQR